MLTIDIAVTRVGILFYATRYISAGKLLAMAVASRRSRPANQRQRRDVDVAHASRARPTQSAHRLHSCSVRTPPRYSRAVPTGREFRNPVCSRAVFTG